MPLTDFPKGERPEIIRILLYRMKDGDLSISNAAQALFGRVEPYDQSRAETILDELWDRGLCICAGHYRNYDYCLTEKGKQALCNPHLL